MSEFNPIERSLAYILSYTPGVKRFIKWWYQYINYILSSKKEHVNCIYPVKAVSETGCESFFGYYDKSPENSTGEYCVYHKSTQPTYKKPNDRLPVSIFLHNYESGISKEIDISHSYNWQQGTKLQWISGNEIIYNYYNDDIKDYRSKIYNLTEDTYRDICLPVYDVFLDQFALSLNYHRLNALRPDYGYRCIKGEINCHDYYNDGVFFINLLTNKESLIISIEKLMSLVPKSTMKDAFHKVNHIMIAPDGKNFMFMHRWISENGKRYDRLLVSDCNGENIRIIADSEMISHCCWFDSENIVGFLNNESFGKTFYKINIVKNETDLLSKKLLKFGDGHPSIFGNYMIFDSYPDRARMKHLFLYNTKEDTVEEIGEFFESMKYFGETRCDLHPKWNYNGKKVFIDSVHEGFRRLYEIRLGK